MGKIWLPRSERRFLQERGYKLLLDISLLSVALSSFAMLYFPGFNWFFLSVVAICGIVTIVAYLRDAYSAQTHVRDVDVFLDSAPVFARSTGMRRSYPSLHYALTDEDMEEISSVLLRHWVANGDTSVTFNAKVMEHLDRAKLATSAHLLRHGERQNRISLVQIRTRGKPPRSKRPTQEILFPMYALE